MPLIHVPDNVDSSILSFTKSILTSTSEIVDTFPVSELITCKWVLTVTDNTSKYQTKEILALLKPGQPSHTIYGVLGDAFNIDIDVIENAGNIELTIQNNELSTINVMLIRFGIYL